MDIRKSLLPLAMWTMTAAAPAMAQAPVEERRQPASSYADVQRNLEFARRASDQAEAELKRLERAELDADRAMQAAQRELEAAQARRESARRDARDAAIRRDEARRMVEREELAFRKMRQTGSVQRQN